MKAFGFLFLALMSIGSTQAASDWGQKRLRMVETIQDYNAVPVGNEQVLEVMRNVPRHLFVPRIHRFESYLNRPVPIGYGQTISQPYIVALMTQMADINKESKVLEVGTGSGYQAAILAALSDNVFTIEIIPDLAERSRNLFKDLDLPIKPFTGDGYFGLEEHAPFDRIVVTAASSHIPPPLLAQLRRGGKMIIPVGPRWGAQYLLIVSKGMDGKVTTQTVLPVSFVPLVGGQK